MQCNISVLILRAVSFRPKNLRGSWGALHICAFSSVCLLGSLCILCFILNVVGCVSIPTSCGDLFLLCDCFPLPVSAVLIYSHCVSADLVSFLWAVQWFYPLYDLSKLINRVFACQICTFAIWFSFFLVFDTCSD